MLMSKAGIGVTFHQLYSEMLKAVLAKFTSFELLQNAP